MNRSEPLDRSGAVLAVLSLGLLTYGLIALGEGALFGGAFALLCAVPATWILIRLEARSRSPMLPLALFRNRVFSGANALTVLLYAALGGALFLLPFLLIQVHGYSATAAGAAFLPFSSTDFSRNTLQTGVHAHQLAGHVAGLRRGEKTNQCCDILRR